MTSNFKFHNYHHTADTALTHITFTINGIDSNGNFEVNQIISQTNVSVNHYHMQHHLAYKQFELTNHLGNVLATVLDRKTNNAADVVTAQHYYPFGSVMSSYKAQEFGYRFSYNGGEAINEVYGKDNYVDLGERGVDTRLGRLNWSIDPLSKEYPWQSPYAYYANSPIWQIDFKGMGNDKPNAANPNDPNKKGGTQKFHEKKVETDRKNTPNAPKPPVTPAPTNTPTPPSTPTPTPPSTPTPAPPNNYQEQSISFHKAQPAYLMIEGIGVAGTFSVDGVVNVNQNSSGQWQATVGASGSTPAGSQGTVTFSGNAQVLVNGQVTSSAPLQQPTGASVYQTGTYPAGTTTLQLPTSGSVQIQVNVGYSIQIPEGRAVPLPSRTNVIVNIPTAPTTP